MSSPSAFETVCSLLPSLTKEQASDVVIRLAALGLHSSQQQAAQTSVDIPLFAPALFDLCGRVDAPLPVVLSSGAGQKLCVQLRSAERNIDRLFNQPSRTQKIAVFRAIASVILEQCRERGWSISPFAIGARLANTDSAIETAFPGYAAAGLLPTVMAALTAKTSRYSGTC